MKIENLVEKDTVLDDDYLIVNGTDGTKKAKKSNFLSELNSWMPKTTVVSGTTDEQGLLFTGLDVNTVEVLSASCSASIIIPFKGSGGVWGLSFSYATASGLLPQISEERTVKIIYVDLT